MNTVFLILDETPLFQAEFLSDLLDSNEVCVVGAVLVTKVNPKYSIKRYMLKSIFRMTVIELMKLTAKLTIALIRRASVESTLKSNSIAYEKVQYSFDDKVINYIKSFEPEYIVSSNSLYLKAEIREIPTKFTLNRHSGLLPKYGGVWPIFYSLVNNETVIGVTLHLVTSKIDSGKIAAQKRIKVNQGDSLFDLYEKTFKLSGQCVLDAINYCEREIKNLSKEKEKNFSIEYTNTMPSHKDWRVLRQNGFRFI